MARKAGVVTQNSFIKGLITDTSALAFPPDAVTDTLNCVFDRYGKSKRRKGLAQEDGGNYTDNTLVATDVWTEYLWQAVAGRGQISFYVQQVGDTLFFFDASSNDALSGTLLPFSVDLDDHLVTDGTLNPAMFPCAYASGNGNLIVVNRACEPFSIQYSVIEGDITVTEIEIKQRDFIGLNDNLGLQDRPTDTVAGIKTNNPQHYYNLLNQGWYTADALSQWDTARTDLPSNADMVGYFRLSDTDAFDNAYVTANNPGSSPAARGHFILSATNNDRVAAAAAEGFTGFTFSAAETKAGGGAYFGGTATGQEVAGVRTGVVPMWNNNKGKTTGAEFNVNVPGETTYTNIGGPLFDNVVTGISATGTYTGSFPTGDTRRSPQSIWISISGTGNLYTHHTNAGGTSATTDCWSDWISTASGGAGLGEASVSSWYGGKNFGSNPIIPTKAMIYGTSDQGFVYNANPSVTATLYGSNTLPSSPTNGTNIGSTTFTDTTNEVAGRTITCTDAVNDWIYVWVTFSTAGANFWRCTEIEFYTNVIADTSIVDTTERPQATAFFAGRAWFAAIDDDYLASNIFFSRIAKNAADYGKAYQANDPTSEFLSQLLPDDGGVVRIPELGKVQALFSTQAALVIFANNGIWTIAGPSGSGFTAEDYRVKKISDIGMQSPLSIMNFANIPMWWGDDGIYSLTYDGQYETFTAVNVTLPILNNFYQTIPANNRQFVKGVYDKFNNIGYWLYSTDALGTDKYVYDRVLAIDGVTKAFYPWEFTQTGQTVRGIGYYADAATNFNPNVKYAYSEPASVVPGSEHNDRFSYAEIISDDYEDFGTDYESYFVTGYRIDGQGQFFGQSNYVFVYLDTETNASCFHQSVFDWTTSSNTGKWSTPQQIYNSGLLNRSINFRRLKARGKGRAHQMRFYSESGKPFTIIGWSIKATGNSDV